MEIYFIIQNGAHESKREGAIHITKGYIKWSVSQQTQKYGHPLNGLWEWVHFPSDIAFQLAAKRMEEEKGMVPGYWFPWFLFVALPSTG